MSLDRSLKIKGALSRHRNVLTRAERVEQLKDEERWSEGSPLLGLPKVAHRKSHAGQKEKAAPAKEAVPETTEATATVQTAEKPSATKPTSAKPAAAKVAAAKPSSPKKEKS